MTPEQVRQIQTEKAAAEWRTKVAGAMLAISNNPSDRENVVWAVNKIGDGSKLPAGFGETILEWLKDEWDRKGYAGHRIVAGTFVPPEGPHRGEWRFEDGAAIDRNKNGTFSARRAGGSGVMTDASGKADFENFGDAVALIRLARESKTIT